MAIKTRISKFHETSAEYLPTLSPLFPRLITQLHTSKVLLNPKKYIGGRHSIFEELNLIW